MFLLLFSVDGYFLCFVCFSKSHCAFFNVSFFKFLLIISLTLFPLPRNTYFVRMHISFKSFFPLFLFFSWWRASFNHFSFVRSVFRMLNHLYYFITNEMWIFCWIFIHCIFSVAYFCIYLVCSLFSCFCPFLFNLNERKRAWKQYKLKVKQTTISDCLHRNWDMEMKCLAISTCMCAS